MSAIKTNHRNPWENQGVGVGAQIFFRFHTDVMAFGSKVYNLKSGHLAIYDDKIGEHKPFEGKAALEGSVPC